MDIRRPLLWPDKVAYRPLMDLKRSCMDVKRSLVDIKMPLMDVKRHFVGNGPKRPDNVS